MLWGAGCAAKRPLICDAAATVPCCLASRLPPSPRQRHPARLPAAATLPSCCPLGPSCCHPAATMPWLQPPRPSHLAAVPCSSCLAAATCCSHLAAAGHPAHPAAPNLPQLLPGCCCHPAPATATRLLLCCHPAALLPPGSSAATRLLCCHQAALLPACHLDAATLPQLLPPGCCHRTLAAATRLCPSATLPLRLL